MTSLTTQAAMTTSQMPGAMPRRELRLTVVFHPDQSRIGAYAILCTRKVNEPYPINNLALGRHHPILSDGEALSDNTINRQAIILSDTPQGLLIKAAKPDAQVKIGPERSDRCCLSNDEVTAGIAIQLGNAVVLLLREVTLFEPATTAGISALLFPGCAPETVRFRQLIAAIAATDRPVLLLGETGTGKRTAASAIHETSERRDRKFECVNVAGLDPTLAALELFGAYDEQGLRLVREGAFHRAEGGTLLLEQIHDASPIVQILLMQAVTGTIQPIGGPTQKIDARIITSSRVALLNNSQFNAALAHRLAGFELHLTPLRSRKEDIGQKFFDTAKHAHIQHPTHPISKINDNSTAARHWAGVLFGLLQIPWLGNYRELENYLFSALNGYLAPSTPAVVTTLEHLEKRSTTPSAHNPEMPGAMRHNVVPIK